MAYLEPNQVLQGVFGTIWVFIAIIVGIRIILKASELDRRELIAVGLTYIFISSAWWGVVLQFIFYWFFSVKILDTLFLLIANIFIPISLICWIYAFAKIIIPFQKKNSLILITIFAGIWEAVLIVLLIAKPELVGTINPSNLLDSSHGSVLKYFVLSGILIFVITGSYFSIKSIKLNDLEIKWKGIFLLLGWISFTAGALLDALINNHTPLSLIITRLILISSAIEYYLGFFLPNKLKEILIK
jgi:hypothetical protein